MTLSKNRIKQIKSLEQKKYRKEEGLFVAEGHKLVGELMGHFPCHFLAATETWMNEHPDYPATEKLVVTPEELSRASLLMTPQQVLALFELPTEEPDITLPTHSLCLALDGIQNPGNLGTIVRLADWFGIEQLYCSLDTVDIYNPKAVQATMGGMAHVKVHYLPLPEFISQLPANVPVYGTLLEGENLYTQQLSKNGLIVMGNEGKGISEAVEQCITRKLLIPPYPLGRATTESLNVAMATAVVCAEFRRQASLL
jgi:TrmH family RNA methyltransferase